MVERDEVLRLLADERDAALRQMAHDLGVDWEELKAAEGSWAAFQAERDAEMARALCRIGEVAAQVVADVTHDWLRPALLAAGFDGDVADQYEVAWVREDGFRPGLFAQEGVEYGRCAVGYDCPPWPEHDDA